MPTTIVLRERRKDLMTDQARLARARRAVVRVEYFSRLRGKIKRDVIIDTGAPFSVVPFSLWHDQGLAWQHLGSQFLTLTGQPDPEGLTWLGVPCFFGEAKVILVDATLNRTRPLRLVARFPRSRIPSHLENDIILGYNFLADNAISLTLHPASRKTVGALTDVVGHLTIG